jgi:protease I
MKKNVFYTIILAFALFGMVLWGIPLGVFSPKKSIAPSVSTTTLPSDNTTLPTLNQNDSMEKKILMVVAFEDFKDEEYFVPKEVMENNGFLIETASTKTGIAVGTEGGDAIITIIPNQVDPKVYEGIVFVGGTGMNSELDNKDFQKLAQEFKNDGKIVAAICVAPELLAKAGILENVKATVWSSALDKSGIKILEANGALYETGPVVTDGKIVTANGPDAAQAFGQAVVDALNK